MFIQIIKFDAFLASPEGEEVEFFSCSCWTGRLEAIVGCSRRLLPRFD